MSDDDNARANWSRWRKGDVAWACAALSDVLNECATAQDRNEYLRAATLAELRMLRCAIEGLQEDLATRIG